MTHTVADPNVASSVHTQPAESAGRISNRLITRAITVVAIVVLMGVLVREARSLWSEWALLQSEKSGVSHNAVIGYHDIAPVVTYAVGPNDWFRREGDESLLWAKWEAGVGHQWFRFAHGDIERARVARPPTILISRPIDYPITEIAGGEVWQRVPPESEVVGLTLEGVKCAYPVLVLGKVQVVNDVVEEHPFLIVVNLFAAPDKAYSIYDANHEGHRLTMDASGYFHDGKPLLYDRGTRSLWVEESDGLAAIAGKHKRAKLVRVASPAPVSWKTWLSQNQASRLLVGADRGHGIPAE
jgi:Protein of unknown function (DUF3179)